MIIAVDFDGTIVEHEYPAIGREIPFATETLKMLMKQNHKLIMWSVREGKLLDDAVKWCKDRGVEFYAVNKDYPEETLSNNNHFSRKLKADVFIDDRNLGGLPDWGQIYNMIQKRQTWEDIINESSFDVKHEQPKRKKKWGIF
ncbi:BT0820 family HAD-type phosphatase [Prevotella sp.]|uniref:BT0820 family HAD-type phosphatase n=1 Tax=uncultured Prevotella sp. TaxID=159272 RepID=UPI0025D41DF1|nr:hypothetical protein [Prevotella sp.]MCI7119789.1 hypothetical protein [Prevotella sp.]